MFDPEHFRKLLTDLEALQKRRFVESGESFVEFFTSREELDQDAVISVVRHMLMFAEMETIK